ncbi:hypothetical protein ABW21_db0205866 [Orbilia brochopaga]|nr:hypothetical protein ABW21_db0205866 [Drechslerella brochopaga]
MKEIATSTYNSRKGNLNAFEHSRAAHRRFQAKLNASQGCVLRTTPSCPGPEFEILRISLTSSGAGSAADAYSLAGKTTILRTPVIPQSFDDEVGQSQVANGRIAGTGQEQALKMSLRSPMRHRDRKIN